MPRTGYAPSSGLDTTRCVGSVGLCSWPCYQLGEPLPPVATNTPPTPQISTHCWLKWQETQERKDRSRHEDITGLLECQVPSLSPVQAAFTSLFPTCASSRELLLVSIDPQSALPTLFMSLASPRALGTRRKTRKWNWGPRPLCRGREQWSPETKAQTSPGPAPSKCQLNTRLLRRHLNLVT